MHSNDLLSAFASGDPLAELVLNLHFGAAEKAGAQEFAAAIADADSVIVLDDGK